MFGYWFRPNKKPLSEDAKREVGRCLAEEDIVGMTTIIEANQLDTKRMGKDDNLIGGSYGPGYTLLTFCAVQDKLIMMKYLIETHKVTVNRKEKSVGWTPLMYAAANGRMEMVQYLVEQCQADMNITNNEGQTAADLAENRRKNDVATYLSARMKYYTHSTASPSARSEEDCEEEKAAFHILEESLRLKEHEIQSIRGRFDETISAKDHELSSLKLQLGVAQRTNLELSHQNDQLRRECNQLKSLLDADHEKRNAVEHVEQEKLRKMLEDRSEEIERLQDLLNSLKLKLEEYKRPCERHRDQINFEEWYHAKLTDGNETGKIWKEKFSFFVETGLDDLNFWTKCLWKQHSGMEIEWNASDPQTYSIPNVLRNVIGIDNEDMIDRFFRALANQDSLQSWLNDMTLPQHYNSFVDRGFTMTELSNGQLTDEKLLHTMNVEKIGHRMRILLETLVATSSKNGMEDSLSMRHARYDIERPGSADITLRSSRLASWHSNSEDGIPSGEYQEFADVPRRVARRHGSSAHSPKGSSVGSGFGSAHS